jgi:hypothetical protein
MLQLDFRKTFILTSCEKLGNHLINHILLILLNLVKIKRACDNDYEEVRLTNRPMLLCPHVILKYSTYNH